MHTPGARQQPTPFLLISPTPLSPLGPCPACLASSHTSPEHRADRHFRRLQSEHKHKYFAPPLSRRSFHHPTPKTPTLAGYISLPSATTRSTSLPQLPPITHLYHQTYSAPSSIYQAKPASTKPPPSFTMAATLCNDIMAPQNLPPCPGPPPTRPLPAVPTKNN